MSAETFFFDVRSSSTRNNKQLHYCINLVSRSSCPYWQLFPSRLSDTVARKTITTETLLGSTIVNRTLLYECHIVLPQIDLCSHPQRLTVNHSKTSEPQAGIVQFLAGAVREASNDINRIRHLLLLEHSNTNWRSPQSARGSCPTWR